MTKLMLRLIANLPLWLVHFVGAILGWIVYLASPRYAARMRGNLAASGLCADRTACGKLLRRAIAEAGKGVAELPVVWGRPLEQVVPLVRQCHGWQHIEETLAAGRGIIFLTPHLGCFEIAALYIATRLPITVLYRPPKLGWIEPWMKHGRGKGQVTLVPTDMTGVKALLKALKRGETVGILPDQVPGMGDGVWADFLGRPAYTMTLAWRLAKSTGAQIVMTFAERMPGGAGYVLTFKSLAGELPDDREGGARQLNQAIEELVRSCPAQYLWSYNRYKIPSGAAAPELD